MLCGSWNKSRKTERFISLVRENYFPSQRKSFSWSEKKTGVKRHEMTDEMGTSEISSKCRIGMSDWELAPTWRIYAAMLAASSLAFPLPQPPVFVPHVLSVCCNLGF